jgi:hypothetical protein
MNQSEKISLNSLSDTNPSTNLNTSSSDSKFNTEKMSRLCDDIIRTLALVTKHKSTYKTDKNEMLRIVKFDNPVFYDKYPRICRTLVFEDDISPLLGMIQTFAQVQEGKISFDKANNLITSAINAKYIDPVLNSDKLVKEREEKQKVIDISEK